MAELMAAKGKTVKNQGHSGVASLVSGQPATARSGPDESTRRSGAPAAGPGRV